MASITFAGYLWSALIPMISRLAAAEPSCGSSRSIQGSTSAGWFSAPTANVSAKRARVPNLCSRLRLGLTLSFTPWDGFLPYAGAAVKDRFEELKHRFEPDLILTHYRGDAHQDHRVVSELTWNTFRDHLILEFEIPKYDGDFGAPNLFVSLSKQTVEKKLDHLVSYFKSQAGRRWFTEDLFRSVMRLRGMECNAPDGHAEAFYSRKATI